MNIAYVAYLFYNVKRGHLAAFQNISNCKNNEIVTTFKSYRSEAYGLQEFFEPLLDGQRSTSNLSYEAIRVIYRGTKASHSIPSFYGREAGCIATNC